MELVCTKLGREKLFPSILACRVVAIYRNDEAKAGKSTCVDFAVKLSDQNLFD